MCSAKEVRELAVLLRISREFDIVGDVSVTVDEPSELLAWALALDCTSATAWRTADSGRRYLQVSANRHGPPIRGLVTAVLRCDQQLRFWDALGLDDLQPGAERDLSIDVVSGAWAVMPLAEANDAGFPYASEG
jgi:hypothetical protein